MRIYIDEAGNFLVPTSSPNSFSLVLALVIPSSIEAQLFYEFLRLRDSWSRKEIEIKGSSLSESEAAAIIDLVAGFDVVVEFVALDMATHPDALVTDFKVGQAEAVTANITREHQPGIVQHLVELAKTTGELSNQLFLQSFLTIHLVIETIRSATIYYAQRQPKELGDIGWVIDRKNRTMTEMEEMWTKLILPAGESRFAKEPLICLAEGDYSYFHARYSIDLSTDAETARHVEWMRRVHGDARRGPHLSEGRATSARRLLAEQQQFEDSQKFLGLQLADMLAAILRRALNNRLQFAGWMNFGKLLTEHARELTSSFLQLGPGPTPIRMHGHAGKVGRELLAKAKPILAEDS